MAVPDQPGARAYLTSDWRGGKLQWRATHGRGLHRWEGPTCETPDEAIEAALERTRKDAVTGEAPSDREAAAYRIQALQQLESMRATAQAKLKRGGIDTEALHAQIATDPDDHSVPLHAVPEPVLGTPQVTPTGRLVEDPERPGNFHVADRRRHRDRDPYPDAPTSGYQGPLGPAPLPMTDGEQAAALAEIQDGVSVLVEEVRAMRKLAEPRRFVASPSTEPTATEAMAQLADRRLQARHPEEPGDRPRWMEALAHAAYGDRAAIFTSMDTLVSEALDAAFREGRKIGRDETGGPPEGPGAA